MKRHLIQTERNEEKRMEPKVLRDTQEGLPPAWVSSPPTMERKDVILKLS